MKISMGLEANRARETTETEIRDFWELLAYQITTKDIGPSQITNLDEHGITEGATRDGKVVGSSLTSRVYEAQSDATTWVTILEAIIASGKRLTPTIVFTGVNLQGQWFPEEIEPWKYTCTKTGWSNSRVALEWLQQVYLPETQPENPQQWRLLILDGHTTHTSVEFMYTAWKNRVQILYLPAHTSHITQPLDVGIFSPLKNYFHQEMRSFASFSATAPVQKQRFLRCYYIASRKAFDPRNIRAAFRGAGIWPVDVEQCMRNKGDYPYGAASSRSRDSKEGTN